MDTSLCRSIRAEGPPTVERNECENKINKRSEATNQPERPKRRGRWLRTETWNDVVYLEEEEEEEVIQAVAERRRNLEVGAEAEVEAD